MSNDDISTFLNQEYFKSTQLKRSSNKAIYLDFQKVLWNILISFLNKRIAWMQIQLCGFGGKKFTNWNKVFDFRVRPFSLSFEYFSNYFSGQQQQQQNTWELYRNANSWAPTEILGANTVICYKKLSKWFWCILELGNYRIIEWRFTQDIGRSDP